MMPSQGEGTTSLANESPVVGFHDEQTLIADRLTRGSRKLQIVAIVGMAGLGKTTLATSVYTNPSVLDYFSVRAWSPVSQVVNKKKVLLDLFSQINPSKSFAMLADSQPDVADRLRKSLKGRKYLIFLDDMWDIEAWHSLRVSFPDDNVGSRIILTSRRHDVAPHDLMVDRKPHFLRELNEKEGVELFQKTLSSGNGLPPLSRDLGMKIAVKCRGLPLMIVIVAGFLKSMEPKDWNGILDGMRNDHMHYKNTLELSYNHLPPHLRPCFLYFGAFKEDEEVSVRRLLRLWIAEGFVPKDNTKSPEDVAERFFRDLIGRSLIMVAKQRSDGGVKACRIHDLLHEFCIQKAKDEHLFHFLKDYDELSAFNEPQTLQRLCIQSEVRDLTESRLFCPRARSLIYYPSQSAQSQPNNAYKSGVYWVDISSTIQISKLLTVLDLEQVRLGDRFPAEIEQLVQLAFLAIRCKVSEIPSFIGNLSNLETFILQHHRDCPAQLPDSLWNLQKLQYLYINNHSGCYLPENNLESSSTLNELEKFSGANIPYSKMKNLLEKIRNVRRLKCIVSCKNDEGQNLVVDKFSFEIMKQLESLYLSVEYPLINGFDLFSLPAVLKKLTLREVNLSWRNLSTIGELPKLEVLKLLCVQMEGKTWEMKEGEFPRLRILKLRNPELVKWITNCDDDDEDQLGCFEKLVLHSCHSLEELPSCLDIIPTLNVIEVSHCYIEQVDLVEQIKERREVNMGDSSLKIITSYTMDLYY